MIPLSPLGSLPPTIASDAMKQFIHSADFHLGAPNQPANYREMSIPKLVEEARYRGINHILVAGDVFDRPNPDQRIKDYFMAQLIGYSDINFILMVGNHDYLDKAKSYHSLNLYGLVESRVPNVQVLGPGSTVIDGVNFVVLPDDIKKYRELRKPCGTNVLVWHGVLPGGDVRTMDFGGSVHLVTQIMSHFDATYFALGDIHQPIEVAPKCYYSGSLYQKTYTCKSGVRVVNVETGESEGFSLDLPSRIELNVKYDTSKDTEDKLSRSIKKKIPSGSLLKLKFRMPLSRWSLIDKRKLFESLRFSYLEVRMVNDPVPERTSKRAGIDRFSKAASIEDEIKTILETDKYENKDTILSKCLEYFNRKED